MDERADECAGQELNLQVRTRTGYSRLGLPMPNRRVAGAVARVGVEPTDASPRFELGRFAGLRTVPSSVPDGI
jgi:hypothetical protein